MFNRIKSFIASFARSGTPDSVSTAPEPNPLHKMPRPTRTFSEFFSHLKSLDFDPKTVIDVGVASGTPALYEAFEDSYFILVEPLSDFVPDMQQILEKYKGEYHNCALTSEAGEGTILKAAQLYGSTMMHRHPPDSASLQKVETKTLDDLFKGRQPASPVLLKTDCQGGDYDVVKGGVKTLKLCDVVIMEVSLFKFWGPHHPDPLEIFNFMSANGFVVYDFLDGLFRPYDNALGQIDVAFVKRNGRFRKQHFWIPR